MSVPYVPHAFKDGDNLDLEKINDNLEAISRSIQRNLDARYTYSHIRFDLDGLTESSAEVLRELAIRRRGANNAVEVFAVELVIVGDGSGDVWTLACSDTTWPSITLTTVSGEEVTASSNIPVGVTSNSADLELTLSCSSTSTITRGYLIVHLRCDRGNQGSSHAGYFPTLVTSATANLAGTLDTELTNLGSAVARDTANDTDLRAELYMVRSLSAGSSRVFRVPSGARRIQAVVGYVVQAAGGSVDFEVASASGAFSTVTLSVNGAGATSRAVDSAGAAGDVIDADDPTDSADDETITITAATQTAVLAYLIVYWS